MAGQATAEIRPEFTLGTEIYEETYLEWHQGRRFMEGAGQHERHYRRLALGD